jgi:hypothetical protein
MAKPPQPPARKTMEVDISWLEEALEKDGKAKAAKAPKAKPPRMPGAAVTVPPLPVAPEPPRRNTIDVQMEWIELVDEHGNVVKKLTEKK